MASRLSRHTSNRDNNFNLLRFIAASMVLFSHSYALSGTAGEPLKELVGFSLGHVAVDIFFITSGFLVTASLLARNNLLAFIWARFLRIYPALTVSVIFCVFIVGLFFTTTSKMSYLANHEIYKFIIYNITLILGHIQYTLPTVFVDNPWKNAMNGSLWTLPWEIKMYAVLIVFGAFVYVIPIFKKKTLNIIFLFLGASSTLLYLLNHIFLFSDSKNIINALRFTSMFFIGASAFILKDKIVLSHRIAISICILFIILAGKSSTFFVVYSSLVFYLVLYASYLPSGRIRLFNKLGDYSYGMYIYAFPVQQSISALITNVSFEKMVVISFIVTLAIAIISWHYIEKPALKMKGSYAFLERKIDKFIKSYATY